MSSIYKESKNESKAQNNDKITEKHKKKEKWRTIFFSYYNFSSTFLVNILIYSFDKVNYSDCIVFLCDFLKYFTLFLTTVCANHSL